MSVEPDDVNRDDLTPADREILDELRQGARTKKAIVDATGLHRNTVGNRLDVLAAGEVIRCIHDTTALYELIDDPRTDDSAAAGESDPERADRLADELAECRAQLTECQERLASADGTDVDLDAVRTDLERAREHQEWAAVEDALARLGDADDAE